MARPNADVDEGGSSFLDMHSFMHALPILPESRPSAPALTEAHSTSLASTIAMAHMTEAPDENPAMEKRRRRQMNFREILASGMADEDNPQAWTRALVQYHREQGEHGSANVAASSHAEIPMSAVAPAQELIMPPPGMTRRNLALPPINAAGLNHILLQTKSHDPVAQALIKKNTKRLQECGIVEKLASEEKKTKPDGKTFSKVPDDDGETVNMRVRAAHERLQAFIKTLPEDEPNPQPPFASRDPLAASDTLAPFAPRAPRRRRRGSRR
ncbi:hypothetical protein PENARI_c015G06867 [Penicillium arizonense]|uniref:Uncharacterized protein n=1 Tax=Penicillium arizonense TaxID=1835702 RepID=A0A1F5LDF4_PENAI|nr:hypothetical protein PENARI_c015G06867 [Penicillium arizonense]OGE51040.1 hypothetical protein PENARI_c015G06867 [Penicillium arizonense]